MEDLTVAEIKAELKRRNVYFHSKSKKQELLALLAEALGLPVPLTTSKSNRKKNKNGYWRQDHPIRKLLYFEFKEGNIPLDPNEMGPAEIYCQYHNTDEFAGVDYDEMFIERLKSLRAHVLKEEPLLKWNESHPARQLIYDEIAAGNIPLEAQQMTGAEVWSQYADTVEFKMRGMKYGETFNRRLAALRKLVKKDKSRAIADTEAVAIAIRNHPPPTHNVRGEPQWNGSKAQQLLKEDITAGKHLEMSPLDLRMTRPEYQAFLRDTIRWKIHQEVKTRKYLHTLKHDAEQKLRKNLKMSTTMDGA